MQNNYNQNTSTLNTHEFIISQLLNDLVERVCNDTDSSIVSSFHRHKQTYSITHVRAKMFQLRNFCARGGRRMPKTLVDKSKNTLFPCQNGHITKVKNEFVNKHDLAIEYNFNADQIGVYEETFKILDKDSNGFITLHEIREIMNSLGYWPSEESIRQKIKAVDSDDSGTVDFREFICMMSTFCKVKNHHELDQELREIFQIFDKNRDGFIDFHELKDVLTKLGEEITEDEVSEMIEEADIDGDGKVSFTEFKSILYENKSSSLR